MSARSAFRKITVTMAAVAVGASTMFGIDYNHAVARKDAANWKEGSRCAASFYAFGPYKAVGANYRAVIANLAGPETTREIATKAKGKIRGSLAYAWVNKRADDVAACYDLPVSGALVRWSRERNAPKQTL